MCIRICSSIKNNRSLGFCRNMRKASTLCHFWKRFDEYLKPSIVGEDRHPAIFVRDTTFDVASRVLAAFMIFTVHGALRICHLYMLSDKLLLEWN